MADINLSDIEAQLDALEPEGRPYERRLFSYNQKFEKAEPHFLIFRSLQRLNIVDIQNRLSEFNNAILMDGHAPPTAAQRRQLSGTLRSYGTQPLSRMLRSNSLTSGCSHGSERL